MSIDPITLSVIQAGLQQVCDEMDLSFSRAAFSPVIAEANDRSDGIYAAEDGALIAQGAGGLPVFVGTMQYSTRKLIEMIAAGTAQQLDSWHRLAVCSKNVNPILKVLAKTPLEQRVTPRVVMCHNSTELKKLQESSFRVHSTEPILHPCSNSSLRAIFP